MKSKHRRSPIALAVLALLVEEPMHPYRMQQLIRQRNKDEVINVRQRASLYQTIERLQRAGLIRVLETERKERWPERTVYELTEEGRETAGLWLREMLSTPAAEFPEFPAALAYLPLLAPGEVLSELRKRLTAIDSELGRIDAEISAAQILPRLFLIETEYLTAMLTAERDWLRGVIEDLRSGRLTWSDEWLREVSVSLEQAAPTTERSQA